MKTVTIITLLLLAGAAYAGPPLICHPFDIGSAKSLPWLPGKDFRGQRPDYDRARLVADTLELLKPDTPVIVRMETLRRATIYAEKDPARAEELLKKLIARVHDGVHDNDVHNNDALALFDAGYLAESYRQWNVKTNVDGYSMVLKALDLRGGRDADIKRALDLMRK